MLLSVTNINASMRLEVVLDFWELADTFIQAFNQWITVKNSAVSCSAANGSMHINQQYINPCQLKVERKEKNIIRIISLIILEDVLVFNQNVCT